MTPQQQFIAGVVFAGAAILFLWRAFEKKDAFQRVHYDIVHFICAFCAGAAGVFFTGSALFSLEMPIDVKGKLAVQGTAGVALFMFVFFIFRWRMGKAGAGGTTIGLGGGNPFDQIAQTIAAEVGATIDLSSLTAAERAARPSGEQLTVGTTAEQAKTALLQLRDRVLSGSIRPYNVTYDAATQQFKIVIV